MTPLDYAAFTLLAPLGVALVLALWNGLRQTGKLAAWISVATALLSAFAAAKLLGAHAAGEPLGGLSIPWLIHGDLQSASPLRGSIIELGVRLDGISVSMLVVVTFVAACVQLFSLGYMADETDADYGRYFTWQSLFLFAMNSLVLAPNLLQLFLGWELVGLVSYLLIGFYYKKPSAARAAVKAFWVTKFADIGLLLGIIVLFVDTGTFAWTVPVPHAELVAGLLFFAVMGKSAQFPLHIWLPDAMEGPTPVSALLHAATMVAAGVFLVVRASPLFAQAPDVGTLMVYVGSFTALFAAVIAVTQNDIKKVLAYSTCSQLGYMVAALGAGNVVGGFFHLTTHAFFKALLFLAAGAFIHAVHSNDIRHMGGLLKPMKISGWTFIIGAAALAGLPGFAGFFSKDLILEGMFEAGHVVPLIALIVAAGLTAFYMGRVVFIALLGEPSMHAHEHHPHPAPPVMQAPLIALAVPALLLGFGGPTLAAWYGQTYSFHLGAVGITASAMALAGLAGAWFMFGPKQGGAGLKAAMEPLGRLAASGAVDRAWIGAYRAGLLTLANAIGWFDRYVIDGLINVVGEASLRLGQAMRPLQTGNVQHYLYAVALGLLALGTFGMFAQ